MSTRRDFNVLRKEIHHGVSSLGSIKVLSAVALIGLGAGFFLLLPEDSDDKSQIASAAANVPESTAAADESLCDKQAWPYIDQRCAQRVEAARGMRQVRIVTDKGHSVTTVTPVPIVEPQPKPAPQTPVVAQAADRPIGPPAVPMAAEPTTPLSEKVAVAPANPPAATQAMAPETPAPSPNTRNAPIAPAAASAAPVAPGVDAFADAHAKKSKSARAAEKTEKRDAKRRKAIEEDDGGVPEDVVAAVKSLPAGGQNSRRARSAVPDEVLQAVEEATADPGGRRGRRIVTIGSPNGGQRMYLVPRDGSD